VPNAAPRFGSTLGGRIDPEHNPPIAFEGKVTQRIDTQWGKTTILQHQGIHVILTEMPFPAYFASDFTGLGINLWKADIVVVKNLFPFPLPHGQVQSPDRERDHARYHQC
jgi:microcystin degradation protein MlrC